jgi:outer membrane lipopolysaccharide assembly protein LptE/RlpB
MSLLNRIRWHRVLALSLVLVTSNACGYALAGHGSFLPAYIRTIGIPTFTNTTSYFDLAQIVTDKVRTEFIGRGSYQIIPEAAGADAVLVGTVSSISILPTAFSSQQQASRYTITVTANLELRDAQKNTVLWSNPAVVVRDEIDATGAATSTDPAAPIDPAAFFNQETNAVQRVSDEFARTVVSAILEAF